MDAPGYGRGKYRSTHYSGDKADAGDSHQSSLLNRCINSGVFSMREASVARSQARD